jgi:hypothetical protein
MYSIASIKAPAFAIASSMETILEKNRLDKQLNLLIFNRFVKAYLLLLS